MVAASGTGCHQNNAAGRLQRLVYLTITGAIPPILTAAVKTLLGLPSLDIHIKGVTMN